MEPAAPRAPGRRAGQDLVFLSRAAVDETLAFPVLDAPLDGVPDPVAEGPDLRVHRGQILLARQPGAPLAGGGPGGPGLSKHQFFAPAIALIQGCADLLHQIAVQQAHKIEPEAIHVVFLGPVENRIPNVGGAHRPLAGQVVAALGAVRPAAVGPVAVIVAGHRPLQPGIPVIGVVVDHIHNHPEPLPVEGLDRLFQLPNPQGPVGGVQGVGALRHVVVHRVVAPVEGIVRRGLIHRAVVKHRHQLDVIHPQPAQISQPGGLFTLSIEGSVRAGKCLVLAPVSRREPAALVPGKLPHMDFVNDVLRLAGGGLVLLPAGGVSGPQVHHHAAGSVESTGPGIGVGGGLGHPFHRHLVIIIGAVEGLIHPGKPYSFVQPGHGENLPGFSLMARGVQPELHRLGGGSPEPKLGALLRQPGPQVIACIVKLSPEAGAVEDCILVFHLGTPPFYCK